MCTHIFNSCNKQAVIFPVAAVTDVVIDVRDRLNCTLSNCRLSESDMLCCCVCLSAANWSVQLLPSIWWGTRWWYAEHDSGDVEEFLHTVCHIWFI